MYFANCGCQFISKPISIWTSLYLYLGLLVEEIYRSTQI